MWWFFVMWSLASHNVFFINPFKNSVQIKVAQIYFFYGNVEITGKNLKLGRATALMNSDLSLPFSPEPFNVRLKWVQTLVVMQYAAMLKMCSMQNHYPSEKKRLWKIQVLLRNKYSHNSYRISDVYKTDTTLLQHHISGIMTFPYHSTTWVMSV